MDFPNLYPAWKRVPIQFSDRVDNDLEDMGGGQFFDRPLYGIRDQSVLAVINKYVPGDNVYTMQGMYPLEASMRLKSLGVDLDGGYRGAPIDGVKELLDAHRKKRESDLKNKEDKKEEVEVIVPVREGSSLEHYANKEDHTVVKGSIEPPRVVNPTQGTDHYDILKDQVAVYDVTIKVPPLTSDPVAAISQKGEGERCKTITVADQQFRKTLPMPYELAKIMPFYPMKGDARIVCEGVESAVVLTLYDKFEEIRKCVVLSHEIDLNTQFKVLMYEAERRGLDLSPFRYESLSLMTTAVLQNFDFVFKEKKLYPVKTARYGTFFGLEKIHIRNYMNGLIRYFQQVEYAGPPDVGAEIFRACIAMRPDALLISQLYQVRGMLMQRHEGATEMIVVNPSVKWNADVIEAGKEIAGYVNALGRIKPPAVAYVVHSVRDYLALIRLAAYLRVSVYHTNDPPAGCPVVGGVRHINRGRPGLDLVSLNYFAQLKSVYFVIGGLLHRARASVGVANYKYHVVSGDFIRLVFVREHLIGAQVVAVFNRGQSWHFTVKEELSIEPTMAKVNEIVKGDVYYEGGEIKVVHGLALMALAYGQMVCGFLAGTCPPPKWAFYTTIKAEWCPVYMPLMVPAPSDFVSFSRCESESPTLRPGGQGDLIYMSPPPMPTVVSLAYTE